MFHDCVKHRNRAAFLGVITSLGPSPYRQGLPYQPTTRPWSPHVVGCRHLGPGTCRSTTKRRDGHHSPRGRTTRPPNGGMASLEVRHANSQLLKVQNPHRYQCGGRHRAGCGACEYGPGAAGDEILATGNKGDATARQNSPSTSRTDPLPVQNSLCSRKIAPFWRVLRV